MGLFSSLTRRSNADTNNVEASWWNDIIDALIAAFPGLAVSTSSVTIANNQSSYANITGLLLDKDTYTYYKIQYRIERSDDNPDVRMEVGTINARYVSGAWTYTRSIEFGNALGDGSEGGDYGTDYLSINSSTGQAEYKSSNMSGGSYAGTFDYKISETWGA